MAAVRVASRAMTLVRSVVLAHFLAPEDFGLFGITMLGLTALETVSQTGFQTALIQKRLDDRRYLDTAWTVSLLRGIFLCGVLVAAAPWVAAFFHKPPAVQLIRVMALSFLVSGTANIGIVLLNKELDFRRTFYLESGGSLADLVTAVLLAVFFHSVWALVGGVLAGNLMRTVLSYLVHPYRPRPKILSSALTGLLGYGGWVNIAGIIIFLNSYGDDIFIGRLLGANALGFYQMAFLLANVPATEFTRVISNVTFPAYSKLYEDVHKFRTAFLKVFQLTGLLVLPLAAFLFVAAHPVVDFLFGERWLPMVKAMEILCLYGGFRAIGATMTPVLYAAGKPRTQAILSGLQFIVMVVLIYPLSTAAGIEGTAFAVATAMVFVLFLVTIEVRTVLELSIGNDILRSLLPFLVAATGGGAAVLLAETVLHPLPSVAVLSVSGAIFVLLYAAVLILWNTFVYRISGPLREIFFLIFRSSSVS